MSVYVDDAYIIASVKSGPNIHTSRWCHMTADTPEELMDMALAIGLKAKYLQHPGTWKEHFDVTEPKRAMAVKHGAIEVGYRERVMQLAEGRMNRRGR